MRLESVGMPDTSDTGLTQSRGRRHSTRAPVRGIVRFFLCGPADYLSGTVAGDGARSARPGAILLQRFDTAIKITVAPPGRFLRRDSQLRGDLLVLQAFRRPQDDPRPLHQPS